MTTPGINSTHTDYLTPQNTKVKKESYGKNGTMKETTIFDANGKAAKVVREYDTNGDGKIDRIEILDKVKGNTLNKLSAQEYENKYGKKAEFSQNPDSFGV